MALVEMDFINGSGGTFSVETMNAQTTKTIKIQNGVVVGWWATGAMNPVHIIVIENGAVSYDKTLNSATETFVYNTTTKELTMTTQSYQIYIAYSYT